MTLFEKIAPYLPYGLNMWNSDLEKNELVTGISIDNNCVIFELENYYLVEHQMKPILRPLSDLDRVNFTYQVIDSNTPYYCSVLDDFEAGDIDCTTLSYSHLQILLKNHYDVFGMIESGEAIDINTINK